MDITLATTRGIDRATGALIADPQGFVDLRGFIPDEGRLLVRPGLLVPVGGAPCTTTTDTIAIIPFRFLGGAVVVTYHRTTRAVEVCTVDGRGGTPVLVGTWGTLNVGSAFPHVIGDEASEKVILAHDEETYANRLRTIAFDPAQVPGAQLVPIQADLDGSGAAADVKFRGVLAWNDYLLAWGYGTEAANAGDRKETLRISLPNNPVAFNKQHYFNVGVRGQAIVGVGIAGGRPQILKERARYALEGDSRTTFAVRLMEDVHGVINGRALVSWGRLLFYWAEDGPRVTEGGYGSFDLSIPLDLQLPEPTNLPPVGAGRDVWAAVSPKLNTVLFAWPDLTTPGTRTRAYALSVRRAADYRWRYEDFGQLLATGVALLDVQPAAPPYTGYASATTATPGAHAGTGRQVTVGWTNNNLVGGDVAEVFLKVGVGGTWSIVASVAAVAGPQTLVLSAQQALETLFYAVRVRRGGSVTVGYTEATPDDWTAGTAAGSKANCLTGSAVPTALTPTWSRVNGTTHQVHFAWAHTETGVQYEIVDAVSFAVLAAGITIPSAAVVMPNADLGTTRQFTVRAARSGNVSALASPSVAVWLGPIDTPTLEIYQPGTVAAFEVWLGELSAGRVLEVSTSPDGVGSWVVGFSSSTIGGPQSVTASTALGSLCYWRARWGTEAFGVTDWSAYVTGSLRLTATAVPALPAATSVILYTSVLPAPVGACVPTWAAAPNPLHRVIRHAFGASTAWKFVQTAFVTDLVINLANIFVPSPGEFWIRSNHTGTAYHIVTLYSALLDTSNNQRKIGPSRSEFAALAGVGAPTNLVVTSPLGVGTMRVAWTNNAPADIPNALVVVLWRRTGDVIFSALGPAVAYAGATQQVDGPAGGYPGLPAFGTPLVVRVYVTWAVGVEAGKYTEVLDGNWTVA